MLNFRKIIEVIISLQIIIISTFVPIYFTFPITNKLTRTIELPITWQVPIIIIITLLFKGKTVIKAFSIYLIIGLFFIPVFHEGGSLGYLLTPNFGYLLGIYPLIKIIDKLNRKSKKINYFDFLKYGILGVSSMHIIGIFYNCFQIFFYKQSEILVYSIAKYSLGKYGYHILMITPIIFLIKLLNDNNTKKNDK